MDAYQPSRFGRCIVVERKLSNDGQSGYKVLNENNEEMGRSVKQDLQPILQHFNIQTENPCVVLTQDHCRTFIQSSKDDKMYELFMKATRLEELLVKLVEANADVTAMKETVEKANECKNHKKQLLDKSKELYDRIQKLQKIDMQRKAVVRQMAFVSLRNFNANIDKANSEEEKAKQNIVELETDMQEHDHKLADIKLSIDKFNVMNAEVDAKLQDFKKASELHKAQAQAIKRKIREADLAVDSLQTQRLTAQKRIDGTQRTLQEAQSRLGQQQQQQRRERDQKITQLNSDKESAQQRLSELTDENRKLEAEKNRLETHRGERNEFLKRLGNNHRTLQQHIAQLAQAAQNRILKFNPKAENVRQNFGGVSFRVSPRGPLGMHLTFEPQSRDWTNALHHLLGSSMRIWLCDNAPDQRKLRDIQTRVRDNATVYVTPQVHAIPDAVFTTAQNNERSTNAMCALSVVKSDDLWVLQTLIDQRRLENAILTGNSVKDKIECNRCDAIALRHNGLVVYFKDGYHVVGRNGSTRLVNPDIDPQSRVAHLFHDDVAADEQHFISQLQDNQVEQHQVKKSIDNTALLLQQVQAQLRHIANERRAVQQTLHRLSSQIDGLKGENQDDAVEMSLIEEELERDIAKEAQISSSLAEAIQTQHQVQQELNDFQAHERQERNAIGPLQEQLDKFSSEMEGLVASKRRINFKKEEIKKVILEWQASATKNRERAAELGKALEKEQSAAEKLDDGPLESSEPLNVLEARAQSLQELLKQSEQRNENKPIAAIEGAYEMDKRNFDRYSQMLETVRTNQKKLDVMVKKRRDRWMKERDSQVALTTAFFAKMLSQRGFQGSLEFNHDKTTLHMNVNVSKTAENTSKHSSKSLSGGERSYSTLAFLIALWQSMDCPFRILDEFDVFMDQVVRLVALEILVKHCQQTPRQFIFITPLAISSLPRDDPDINIITMADPHQPSHSQQSQQQ
eukprot:c12951_g1_i3.p1 GENE.c12951_g1_i3~~c12951_g1_i3.p1  ORF type:complete len:1060 (+),score=306.62 c12951_g1_i3:276-3182(+)